MAKDKKPKTAVVEATVPKSLADANMERWVAREVPRSALVNAPYNPRTIGEAQKRKLRAQLEKNGLVAPVTWNKRTGHIVGGHQRIAAMDSFMGTKDYTLTVAEVDVDEPTEKALNIALNNDAAMGKFDLESLGKMLEDAAVDLSKTGFDTADIYEMFGHGALVVSEERIEALAELGTKLREIQELFKSTRANTLRDSGTEYFIVLVGKSVDHVSEILDKLKLNSENRYHSIDNFVAAVDADTKKALGIEAQPVQDEVLALNGPVKKAAKAA